MKKILKSFFVFAVVIFGFCLVNNVLAAGTAILNWNANTESDLAGYKVYYDTVSHIGTTPCVNAGYANNISVGKVTTYTFNNLADGTKYYFTVSAYDTTGNESSCSTETSKTTAIVDVTNPIVSVSSPINNAIVSGTVNISANAMDNIGVAGVQFKVDGVNFGVEDVASPYTVSWDTTNVSNGSHIITAVAKDAAGNSATSVAITVSVNNPDIQAPTVPVNLTAQAVSISQINISWTASTDDRGVAGYYIYKCSTTGCTPAIKITNVSVTSYSDINLSAGTAYIYAVSAYDAANNESLKSVTATATTQAAVQTPQLAVSNIAVTGINKNSATITWTTNQTATSQIEYGLSSNYGYLSALNSAFATSHSMILSGLTSKVTYHYRVKSTNTSGNINSNDFTFTTTGKPSGVKNLKASLGSVILKWTNPTDDPSVVGVVVLKSDTGFILTYNQNNKAYETTGEIWHDTNVIAGKTYYYSVFTYNSSGDYSDPLTAQITIPVPPAPVQNSGGGGGGGGGSAGGSTGGSSGSSSTNTTGATNTTTNSTNSVNNSGGANTTSNNTNILSGNTTTVNNTTGSVIVIAPLIGKIDIGERSEKVKLLQQMLIKDSVYAGVVTGYYDSATIKAVQKFQCSHLNICYGSALTNGYGVAGPKTRTELNRLYSGQPGGVASNITGNSTSTTVMNPDLIATLQNQIKLLQQQLLLLLTQLIQILQSKK